MTERPTSRTEAQGNRDILRASVPLCEHSAGIRPTAPPFPAPYLPGCPQLNDELLRAIHGKKHIPAAVDAQAQAALDSIKAQIRSRREAYERRHGLVIIPERPSQR